jgi:hypothetical protein
VKNIESQNINVSSMCNNILKNNVLNNFVFLRALRAVFSQFSALHREDVYGKLAD